MAMDNKQTDVPISKPKPAKKDNRIGSKTAPLETEFVIIVIYNIIHRTLTLKAMKITSLLIIIIYTITRSDQEILDSLNQLIPLCQIWISSRMELSRKSNYHIYKSIEK